MPSLGPNSAGSGVSQIGVGTIAWANPGNIVSSNDQYAGAFCDGDSIATNWLVASQFGFAVPAGATVNGITVTVEGYITSVDVGLDNRARIVKGGSIGATDKSRSNTVFWAGPATDATWSYGGTSDLWGESWSYSDINATSFGFALSAVTDVTGGGGEFRVDHIQITVQYTDATVTMRQRGIMTSQGVSW